MAYPGQSVTYTYDTCQRVTDEAVRFSAEEAYVTRYTYDGASRIASVVYPSGFTVNHRYNARGYQSAQTDYGGDELYRTKGTSPMGQPERFVLGGVLLNTLEYDPERHLLTMTRTTKNNTSLQNLSFDYDGFCNLASRRDNMRNLEETFTYDSQNRLTGVWLGASQTGSSAYDGYGRMTAKTAGGQPVFSNAVYNTTAKPHAITSAQTTAGLFPSDAQSITYTGFDKVGKVKQGNDSLCYTYGYDRQRILMEEHVGGLTRTKRYVGNCEFVTESDGTTTAEYCLTYLTGPTGVYAVVVTEGGHDKTHYVLKDNLGSWTTITDEDGNVEQRLSYDAWGNLRDPNTWSGSFTGTPMFDRGFTGHEHLYNFGLINMNGRMYDPVMSSFLSVDRYVQSPSNSQNFKRYAYCLNNPLRYTDPSGELLWEAVAAGAIIGSFSNATMQVMSGNVNNGAQFWVSAGIGAISGGLGGAAGYGAGLAAAAWLGGAGMGAGSGIAIGAASASANGLVSASTAAWMQGASFYQGLWAGLKAGVVGELSGALIGGLEAGIYARQQGGNFWTGEGATFDQMNDYTIKGEPVNYSTDDALSFSKKYFGEDIEGLNKLYADGSLPNVEKYKYLYDTKGNVIKYKVLKNGTLQELGKTNGTTVYLGKSKSNVYLYQTAFASKEQLYLTMGHEYIHVGFNANKSLGNPYLNYTQKTQDASCYQWEIKVARAWGLEAYANHLEGIYNKYYKSFLDIRYQPSITTLPPW